MEYGIKILNNELLVSYSFLKGKGITEKLLSNWSCRKVTTKYNLEGTMYVLYRTIPAPTRAKLPTEEQLLDDFRQQEYDNSLSHYYELLKEKQANFQQHFNYIKDAYSIPTDKARDFAKKWAVWQWIMDEYDRIPAGLLNRLYLAYNKLYPDTFTNIWSFSNFRSRCKHKGIESCVIDQRTFNRRRTVIPEVIRLWVQTLVAKDNGISAPKVYRFVKEACEKAGITCCSKSSIKLFCREFRNNAHIHAVRRGRSASQEKLPSVKLETAKHRNTEWQIDGWTLPFWVHNMERWVLVAVWDSNSRKIIGYSIGKTESTPVIMAAFEDAIRNTGVLPSEIVMDKHSFNQTQISRHFKEQTEKYGVIWTVTTNPRRKNVAERYNQYLDDLCQDYPGYLGKGIKVKNEDLRRSPETYERLRRSANQLTPDEVKTIAIDVVMTYNSTGLNPLSDFSPNQKYAESESRNAFIVSEEERIMMIRPTKTYKVVSGQITIQQGIQRDKFNLPADLYSLYNGKYVQVVYEDLEQGIYLFEPETGEYISTLYKTVGTPSSKADQAPTDVKRIQKNAGKKKGIVSKGEKKATAQLDKALMENPEALEYIAPYMIPKDIRQRVEQNQDLRLQAKDRGVNTAMLPIRKPENIIDQLYPAKTKESPFASTKTELRKLNVQDIKDEDTE